MGWNSGYTIFKATVIGAYDLGTLDKDLLKVLMEPYRDSDIDSGGSCDLLSKNGKNVEQIVIETWGLEMPIKPEEEYDSNTEAWNKYYEEIYKQMSKITEHFGW